MFNRLRGFLQRFQFVRKGEASVTFHNDGTVSFLRPPHGESVPARSPIGKLYMVELMFTTDCIASQVAQSILHAHLSGKNPNVMLFDSMEDMQESLGADAGPAPHPVH